MSKIINNLKSDFFSAGKDLKAIYFDLINKSIWSYILEFVIIIVLAICVDPYLRDFMINNHSYFWDKVFSNAHFYGKGTIPLLFFLVLYLVSLFTYKENIRIAGRLIGESFIFTGLLITIIKSVFGRWRPYTEHGNLSFVPFTVGPNDHLSFTSGDVAVAFSLSVVVAGFYRNKLWKIIWLLLATITSIGRIYYDQHWLSDVLSASIIAIYIGNSLIKNNFTLLTQYINYDG